MLRMFGFAHLTLQLQKEEGFLLQWSVRILLTFFLSEVQATSYPTVLV